MNPVAIIDLAAQILRLVNNLIESDPLEVRREKAILWWNMTKDLIEPFVDKATRDRLKAIDAKINAA